MPAAVAIPLIISGVQAGVGAYAAHKASETAQGAANSQRDASNQAIALQRQIIAQQQQNAAPYQQLGQQGLTALGQMAGQRPPAFNPNGGNPVFNGPAMAPQMTPPGGPTQPYLPPPNIQPWTGQPAPNPFAPRNPYQTAPPNPWRAS